MAWRTHFVAAAALRRQIVDADCDDDHRERAARTARRLADRFKRSHPDFSYEWFFGACGLDSWGELSPYARRAAVQSSTEEPECQ
jgi:hypothetical protein